MRLASKLGIKAWHSRWRAVVVTTSCMSPIFLSIMQSQKPRFYTLILLQAHSIACPKSKCYGTEISYWPILLYLQAFVTAGKKYIISTGGTAGTFRCDSDAAFLSFVQRYHTSAMLGVDFDIETDQTQVRERERLQACVLGRHHDQGSGVGAGCPKALSLSLSLSLSLEHLSADDPQLGGPPPAPPPGLAPITVNTSRHFQRLGPYTCASLPRWTPCKFSTPTPLPVPTNCQPTINPLRPTSPPWWPAPGLAAPPTPPCASPSPSPPLAPRPPATNSTAPAGGRTEREGRRGVERAGRDTKAREGVLLTCCTPPAPTLQWGCWGSGKTDGQHTRTDTQGAPGVRSTGAGRG